jgi:NADH:ubiquinone oxidoreductase subunit 4 (subunit M)
MIILSGLFFLIGRGEEDKIRTAKKILTYALIGLVIVLIGSGFITLLESILALGGQ